MCDVINHPLHADHALWSPKSTKGCGTLGIRAQPVAFDPTMIQMIGVVSMQHRTVCHRQRKIL